MSQTSKGQWYHTHEISWIIKSNLQKMLTNISSVSKKNTLYRKLIV